MSDVDLIQAAIDYRLRNLEVTCPGEHEWEPRCTHGADTDPCLRGLRYALQYITTLRAQVAAASLDRDFLGQFVRMVWVEWAKEQPNPKPHWLTPWSELAESDKEVDRRIGERIAEVAGAALTRENERLRVQLAARDARLRDIHELAVKNCPAPDHRTNWNIVERWSRLDAEASQQKAPMTDKELCTALRQSPRDGDGCRAADRIEALTQMYWGMQRQYVDVVELVLGEALMFGKDGQTDHDGVIARVAALRAQLNCDHCFYLVELPAPYRWWTGRGDEWTTNVHDALQFARRRDAERAIGWFVPESCRRGSIVTEHGWMSALDAENTPKETL